MSTIHIGRLVERLVEEKPMQKKAFAKAMNYSPTNISSLFARKDWHVGMVEDAGRILDTNILAMLVKLPDITKEHLGHGSLSVTENYIDDLDKNELRFLQVDYPEFAG